MKKFWIIDGSSEEFETKELAVTAAKKLSVAYSKRPYAITNYPYLINTIDSSDVYVYEAVALAREPEPDVLVEEIT